MTTATALYNSIPLTPVGTERMAADRASDGVTGGMLSQAIADLFKGTKGADIASAATTDIGAATGMFIHVTGTTTITALGTATAGITRLVTFDGALLLTYNATSLILPTSANITTVAGDSALFVSEGSGNWRCLGYWRRDGTSVGGAAIADNSVTNAKLADMTEATIKLRAAGAGTGDPIDGTGAQVSVITQGDGLDVDACGFRGVPQNSQSGNYTCVSADAGKHIFHPSGAGAGDTFTIPDNSSVAYEIGTALTFINMDSNTLAIAITTDTMNLSGTGATGTRTLAQYGVATAVKLTSTIWIISGTGIT